MLVTKHVAELFALLISDIFGELPSRIAAALLSKGRCDIHQLSQHTLLSPRQLRHGLSTLIQQGLLYHETNKDSNRSTIYEVNVDACYHLLRIGKSVDCIGRRYGEAEKAIIQSLLVYGHTRIADLVQAFCSKGNGASVEASLDTPAELNGHGDPSAEGAKKLIESPYHLHEVLCGLIQSEILDVVDSKTIRNPNNIYSEIEEEFASKASKEKTARNKAAVFRERAVELHAARARSKSLKRQLDEGRIASVKRRKLTNGHAKQVDDDDEEARILDSRVVLRINYEKCLVLLRNERLERYVADMIGEVTSQVYQAALHILTRRVSRCRPNPRIDHIALDPDDLEPWMREALREQKVTTLEILEALDPNTPLSAGIGKVDPSKIDTRAAEKIRTTFVDNDDGEDEDMENGGKKKVTFMNGHDSDSDSDEMPGPSVATNGKTKARVTFEDANPKDNQLAMLRQHLLLLCHDTLPFLRHCGSIDEGQWTVDFDPLMQSLRQMEIDSAIEQSFGRQGLRLTRILRARGKVEEKSLASLALLKKHAVQTQMSALQTAGYVDVQEVPRDNSRVAARTMYFWFCDDERAHRDVVDHLYKMMLRCLQTLEVQRYRERDLLSFVDRTDVKDKEEEVMTPEHYNKYSKHLELQNKLLGQIMRLDDSVAVLRDF